MWPYYIKLSWLSIRKTPILSLLMMLAIAMGITACLTTLTMYRVMSSNPLQHKNDRVFAVQLDSWDPDQAFQSANEMPLQLTYQDAVALHNSEIPTHSVATFRSSFTVRAENSNLNAIIRPARVTTADFFSVFDAPFLYGAPWDKSVDSAAEQVVVISAGLNKRLYQKKDSIGRNILLDGLPFKVVGVLDSWQPIPKIYDLTTLEFGSTEDVFIPFSLTPVLQLPRVGDGNVWLSKPIHSYQDFLHHEIVRVLMWVELTTLKQQQAFAEFIENYIKQQKQLGRFQRPLRYALNTPEQWLDINEVVKTDNTVLVGISLLYFTICLVNAVVLLLSKLLRKSTETGIRRALGASRLSIFNQYLSEATIVGLTGSLLGLGMTWLALAGVRLLYNEYDRVAALSVDTLVMLIGFTILASLLSGALPAWFISRVQPGQQLRSQ